jgi:hypothetical protein
MAQKPRVTLGFVTGADVEVNDTDKLGLKDSAQPEAEEVEEVEEQTEADSGGDPAPGPDSGGDPAPGPDFPPSL